MMPSKIPFVSCHTAAVKTPEQKTPHPYEKPNSTPEKPKKEPQKKTNEKRTKNNLRISQTQVFR